MAYEIRSMWFRFLFIILISFFFADCKLKEPQRVSPKAVKHKKMGSKIFLSGWVVFFVIILNDILFHQFIINTTALSPFGFFIFVFSQTLVLSMRYSTLFNQEEKLSEEFKSLVKLEEYVSEIELFLRADFQYAGIDCILDIDYKGNILIDKDRMRRVLINLAKNAIEAMYDGKKDYSFTIRSEKKDNNIIFTLKDNGHGLSEAVEGRIFEAFATDGKTKGTGLGLFMSKWIVEAHNGSLTYETTQGEGTSFFITLPIANKVN